MSNRINTRFLKHSFCSQSQVRQIF
ncbi:hypothetical protein D043_0096A, partial [Vibrio parahaemolyticus EKP-021]